MWHVQALSCGCCTEAGLSQQGLRQEEWPLNTVRRVACTQETGSECQGEGSDDPSWDPVHCTDTAHIPDVILGSTMPTL